MKKIIQNFFSKNTKINRRIVIGIVIVVIVGVLFCLIIIPRGSSGYNLAINGTLTSDGSVEIRAIEATLESADSSSDSLTLTLYESLTLIFSFITFVVSCFGAYLFYKRLNIQEGQLEIQIQQRVDDRFTTAVSLLGSKESSARTGAIYSLHALAVKDEDEKYRKEIAEILCSHIRTKTAEKDYQKEHNERPSNEIRSAINLLFREENSLYKKFSGLPKIDLSFSYLMGAYFQNANLQGATFYKAECQEADFRGAQCQKVLFHETQCQGANFQETWCQGAEFNQAQCQGANFASAQCQGASFHTTQLQRVLFSYAKCQGATFNKVQCQGANFQETWCQGAEFNQAQCQGANFASAQCQGASFHTTQLQGVLFSLAKCQGATFNKVQCQGATTENKATTENNKQSLKNRIGKDSHLDSIDFTGEMSKAAIDAIEEAKEYLWEDWYNAMQKIIEDNKGKPSNNTLPAGIETGILEDSPELQDIITELEKLEEMQKKRQKQSDSDDLPISK